VTYPILADAHDFTLVTAKPPKHPRRGGWPRITQAVVCRGEKLTAMEVHQAAERIRTGNIEEQGKL
jgi:hypothetical protein